MTKEDLKNTKIYLSNEEDVIKFQEKVFKLGVLWKDGSKEPQYIKGEPFYYINSNFKLTKDTMYQNDSFKNHEYEQIFLHDVLSIEESEEEYRFETYDKVLMRDYNDLPWLPTMYAYSREGEYCYVSISGSVFKQCIPYEGNEYLVGTTNSPD